MGQTELCGGLGAERDNGLPFREPAPAAARAVAQGASLAADAVGAVGLGGWIFGTDVLKTGLPCANSAMKSNTAWPCRRWASRCPW